MNFEKYTDRSRGFVQSAQSLAQREGHQQFAPEHLLKVLLDDPDGLAAGLIDRAGGNSRAALSAVEAALNKRPKISGGGAGQIYLDPSLARVFDAAEQAAPSRAFAGRHLVALVDAQLAVVVAVNRDRIAQVDDPALVDLLEPVQRLGGPIHVLLESDDD